MTAGASAGGILVPEVDRGPGLGRDMAGVALGSCGHMGAVLAGGTAAVMAGAAGTGDTCMIKGTATPGLRGVAGIALFHRCYVCGVLAGGVRPIVAGAAATCCIGVIKSAAAPGLDRMASVTLSRRHNVR